MTPTRTLAAIGAALVVGFLSGTLTSSVPTVRAPHDCTVMAAHADEIAELWGKTITAVNDRGNALDPKTYAVHDAEFNHLDESLTVVEAEYADAKASCLGADS